MDLDSDSGEEEIVYDSIAAANIEDPHCIVHGSGTIMWDEGS